MYFKKSWLIVTLLASFALSLNAVDCQKGKTYQHADVEDIYQSIRNSVPDYEWAESIVTFENEGKKLVGTLTVPQAHKLFPIIITLGGFVGNRDEEPIPDAGETVFQRLCHVLAGHGVASLRLDFRGYGESEGEFQDVSFSTQISDVLAAIKFIKSDLHRRVRSSSIGLLGFSQGGIVGVVTAARDKSVESLVLWSTPAQPAICYEGLLSNEGIKNGLALNEGESITLGLYLEGDYLGWDVTLGKAFFVDLFNIDPAAEIRKYKKPLMTIFGKYDIIAWPQPLQSKTLINYHDGEEKIIEIDADHEFDYWDGPDAEKLTDTIFWSTAWFLKTL
jgi:pimeloyl-ACP methyl ester carboxylesterase